MKVNAEEFNKKPRPVFDAASDGEEVVINHDRYRKVFILTARDREPLGESEEKAYVSAIAQDIDDLLKSRESDSE